LISLIQGTGNIEVFLVKEPKSGQGESNNVPNKVKETAQLAKAATNHGSVYTGALNCMSDRYRGVAVAAQCTGTSFRKRIVVVVAIRVVRKRW
jgi:hypothetical protein